LGLAQASAGKLLKAYNELLRAERAAGALGAAQRHEGGAVRVRVNEFAKAADAVEERCYAHERIVASGEMRRRPLPCPVLRLLPAVAALGHVMREVGDDDAADTRHEGLVQWSGNECNM
jgi:hypothetical protein